MFRPRLDAASLAALDRIAVRLSVRQGRPVRESEALRHLIAAADAGGAVATDFAAPAAATRGDRI